jgi:molybdenum cofactor biosynthesis enzyme
LAFIVQRSPFPSSFIDPPSSFLLRLMLSHFDDKGAARMVDVGQKPVTERMARASARVRMLSETLALVRDGRVSKKGDVLQVARLAGVYDMCKSADRGMVIEQIQLEEKSGGKSGHFERGSS